MRTKTKDNLAAALILMPVLILTKLINGIPWWSFVIPVLIFGVIITMLKKDIASFAVGFLAGFCVWAGGTVYFHLIFRGIILSRLGHGLDIIIPIFAGVMGGVLTGLAFYIGKSIMIDKVTNLVL